MYASTLISNFQFPISVAQQRSPLFLSPSSHLAPDCFISTFLPS